MPAVGTALECLRIIELSPSFYPLGLSCTQQAVVDLVKTRGKKVLSLCGLSVGGANTDIVFS